MLIYVDDALRHRRPTGYGTLARHLIAGLHERGHEVVVPKGSDGAGWPSLEGGMVERLSQLPESKTPPAKSDVILQIGTPGACREFDLPSAIYTQNALGGLRRDWIRLLKRADQCIVPTEFDQRIFSSALPSVSVAPQGSNPSVFKPVPRWRDEGSGKFTFMFVGSYGFRKGVDVLLAAFLEEFSEGEPVELWLFCTGLGGQYFNHILRMIQASRPQANVTISTEVSSPAWMCRYYNRADCVVTASRGEGWCMPLTEGLLCGKPVIAPNSTAPGEYLDEETAYLVPVTEMAVSDIAGPFGEGFKEQYGEQGITYFEPDREALREAMRRVYAERAEAAHRAEMGRQMVRELYDWKSAAAGVEDALGRLVGERYHGRARVRL